MQFNIISNDMSFLLFLRDLNKCINKLCYCSVQFVESDVDPELLFHIP